MRNKIGSLILATLLCGCANIHQRTESNGFDKNGQPISRISTSDINTMFTAKQVVESASLSNTAATQKIGATGVEQQSSLAELIKILEILGPIIAAAQQNRVILMQPARLIQESEVAVPGP